MASEPGEASKSRRYWISNWSGVFPYFISIFLVLVFASCDTINAHRIIVERQKVQDTFEPIPDTLLVTVRTTLETFGLTQTSVSDVREEWRWREPDNPPGLWVNIQQINSSFEIGLSQDLFGPIGPTEKYQRVKTALIDAVESVVGKNQVRVKKGY